MNHPLYPPNLFSRLTHSKCWLPVHLCMPRQPSQMSLFYILCQISLLSNLTLSLIWKIAYFEIFLDWHLSYFQTKTFFLHSSKPGQIHLINHHESNRLAFKFVSSRTDLWIPSLVNEWIARKVLETHTLSFSWNMMTGEILINVLTKGHFKPVLFLNFKYILTFFKISSNLKNITKLVYRCFTSFT